MPGVGLVIMAPWSLSVGIGNDHVRVGGAYMYCVYIVESKAHGNARDIEYCFHGPLPVDCSRICVSLFDERASSCAHAGVVDTQSGRELRARKNMRGHVSGIRECAGRGLPSGH